MGLTVIVGVLLDPDDPSAFDEEWRVVNEALVHAGLPKHQEPSGYERGLSSSFDMHGYSGLHYLRRLAAHVWASDELPGPGDDSAAHDPVLARYYASGGERRDWLGRRRRNERRFDHLILHSDCSGLYVPIGFDEVIETPALGEVTESALGSSQRLMAECQELAGRIELPLELNPESDAIWEASDSQGEGEATWQRYGIESFTCLRLYHAAKRSIEIGAAIAFG